MKLQRLLFFGIYLSLSISVVSFYAKEAGKKVGIGCLGLGKLDL